MHAAVAAATARRSGARAWAHTAHAQSTHSRAPSARAPTHTTHAQSTHLRLGPRARTHTTHAEHSRTHAQPGTRTPSTHRACPGAKSRTRTHRTLTHTSTPTHTSVVRPPRGAAVRPASVSLPKQVLHEQTSGCRSSPAAAHYLVIALSALASSAVLGEDQIIHAGRATRPAGAEPRQPPPEQQRQRELHLRKSSRPDM